MTSVLYSLVVMELINNLLLTGEIVIAYLVVNTLNLTLGLINNYYECEGWSEGASLQ